MTNRYESPLFLRAQTENQQRSICKKRGDTVDKIPVCTHYLLNGMQTDRFPFPSSLKNAKPVIEYFDGWKCDISGARSWDDLPKAAQEYVTFIEKQIGCPIKYVSVGPERDSIVIR